MRNANPTATSKFSARVQGFTVAEDVATGIDASDSAISQLRVKLEGAEANIKSIEASNLPDNLKTQLVGSFTEITSEYDKARIVTHETVNGILSGIIGKLSKMKLTPEECAKMDAQQLQIALNAVTEVFKTHSTYFPSKTVSQ